MLRCPHDDCGWQAVAPSRTAAEEQLAEHVVREHATEVDADIPEGMVQVRVGDGEWRTMTPAAARAFHESVHADESPSDRD